LDTSPGVGETGSGYHGRRGDRASLQRRREVAVTITATAACTCSAERSRFHAIVFPASCDEDVQAAVKRARAEHRKANHHCWAARWRDASGALIERSRDDGEVGHPGRVLLELLRRGDLEGGLLVSRVFGGVKLGVGGVSRAFRNAGEAALAQLSTQVEGRR
jgi:putative IMPACT (imprinted ancient) family translation regulator